jgi:teichuronic acid biosynthesis glycosyltransferase TuaG
MDKVSVIIPNYNRAELLIKAIQSALNQTYPIYEILVCDDGSTDNAELLVTELSAKHPKIKWINCGKNGRPAIPRNKGIELSEGTWLAFLDNDDEWDKYKIEEQIASLKNTQCKAVCSNAYKIDDFGSNKELYLSYTKSEIKFEELIQNNWVICSSVMIHKSLLKNTLKFPEESEYKAIEDYALWLKLATITNFCYINKPLVNYLDSPKHSIRKEGLNEWEQRILILKELLAWLQKNGMQKKQYNRIVLKHYIAALLKNIKYHFQKQFYKVKGAMKLLNI